MNTKYIPYIITPKAHIKYTSIGILVKNKVIPKVKLTEMQTIRIPIIAFQFPLQKNAYNVRAMLIAIVAAIATGITGSSIRSTTAEQQKLIMYEKHNTKIVNKMMSRGDLLAFLTQQATIATTIISTIGITRTHA